MIKTRLKYTFENLVYVIETNYCGDNFKWNEELIVFADAEVYITGGIYADYKHDMGDYWTPPDTSLINRWADIYEVLIIINDEEKRFTDEEIYELEERLRV
jgi:hypothetical protein